MQLIHIHRGTKGSISIQFSRNYFHKEKITIGINLYNLYGRKFNPRKAEPQQQQQQQ